MNRRLRLRHATSVLAVSSTMLAAAPVAASAAQSADLRAQQWGLDAANVDAAHRVATGDGVVVAVIDTGLDLQHPDFAGKVVAPASWVCPSGVAVPCFGDHVDDRNGHGTHVAGTIVSPADGVGTTGVAPDASIMPLRVLDADGSGSTADAAAAVDWAIAHGADVINLSLGASFGLGAVISNPVLPLDGGFVEAINRAADAGVFVAVAAGNDSLPYCGGGELYADDAVCVAAHGPDGLPAYYSDWGAGIDVVAPGGAGLGCSTDILATWPLDLDGYCGPNGFDSIAGTSMASPHVAGVGALLAELGVHGRAARQVVIDTAGGVPLTAPGGLTGPYLDAYAAVAGGAASRSTASAARHVVVLDDAALGDAEVTDVAAAMLAPFGVTADTTYTAALRGFSVTLPADLAGVLAASPLVSLVEEAMPVAIAAQDLPAGIDRIDADEQPAAGIGTGRLVDVDVAVIDTGVDDHADLNLASHYNCVSSLFSSGCSQGGSDGHGHGTHVAGTIGALDNGLDVVGVAPGARIHGYKVLNDLLGSGSTADIIDAIEHVTARGDIEVINMSLGGSGSSSATDAAIQGATDAGVIVVVAAGNDSADAGGYTPANSPNAITVSAVTDTDGKAGGLGGSCSGADDSLATYSNYGDVVDIAAPGSCVVSLRPGGGTAEMSGTSMASPHVAGAAALYVAAFDVPVSSSRWQEVLTGLTTTWGTPQDGPCGYATTRNPDPMLHLTGCGEAPNPEPGNTAPTVAISDPADDVTVAPGDTVTFTAAAEDAEDGDLTAAIAWTSNLDGDLGTGGTVDATLTEGVHTVTATVADADGATTTDTVTVTVADDTPPPAATATVAGISYAEGGYLFGSGTWLDITLDVVDAEGAAIGGATLAVEVMLDGESYTSAEVTTSSNGTVTLSLDDVPAGDYTTVVTALTADGHAWDGTTPTNAHTVEGSGGGFFLGW